MQFQETEAVTTLEPNEQIDVHERQPYQAPRLVRLDLSETQGLTSGTNDGFTLS
ncbi:hypothetical protein DFO61_2898 [Ectopseudomonas oleovorans]|uniref:Uncharacterized protein n=1 Tax=Ectopseudomonas oleovorans TaxID=301 RepID=A0A397MKV5_ECTOL|nr:hypothetical protein DFO61_2898 [Pseudomonas oleovorans]